VERSRLAPFVIPQERAKRASVGIGVRHAMPAPFTVRERRHRGRDGDPDTRLAGGEAPAG